MQITLRLCDSLHAKVREKARELGRSVNSYLVQLIQSDLQLPESPSGLSSLRGETSPHKERDAFTPAARGSGT